MQRYTLIFIMFFIELAICLILLKLFNNRIKQSLAIVMVILIFLGANILYLALGSFNLYLNLSNNQFKNKNIKNVRLLLTEIKRKTIKLQLATLIDQNNPDIWQQLGQLYQLQQDFERSDAAFEHYHRLITAKK